MNDVDALRGYWRSRAESWWKQQGPRSAVCDYCNAPIAGGSGYLFRQKLICEKCCARILSDAETRLAERDDWFGEGEVEAARNFAAEQS